MLTEYEKLAPMIRNWVHNESQKTFRGKVVEVHLSSSSVIRKENTLNRIRNLISKHNLSLKVFEDDTMLKSDRFIISKI